MREFRIRAEEGLMRAVEKKACGLGVSVAAYCRMVLAKDAGVDVSEAKEWAADDLPIYKCRLCPGSAAMRRVVYKAHNLRCHGVTIGVQ